MNLTHSELKKNCLQFFRHNLMRLLYTDVMLEKQEITISLYPRGQKRSINTERLSHGVVHKKLWEFKGLVLENPAHAYQLYHCCV
jgi:hypothetical protein